MSSDPPERSRQTGTNKRQGGALTGALGCLALLGLGWNAAAMSAIPGAILSSPTAITGLVLALLAMVLMNGCFVAGETALDLLRSSHLRQTEEDAEANRRLSQLMDQRQALVAAAFMGSQTMRAWMILLCLLPALAIAENWQAAFPAPRWILVLGAAALIGIPVAFVNVVLGELIPRSLATVRTVNVCLKLELPLRFFSGLFWIPTRAAQGLAGLVTKRFGAEASFALENQAEVELKNLIETYSESGQIEEEESDMLDSVFEFGETVAREVMTPRVDVDSVSIDATLMEAIELIVESGHSRLPVYERSDDQILGIVHAKDILSAVARGEGDRQLRTFSLRPAHFVPENKGLHELLQEMRLQRTQMMIVQDEFGGTAGIVTIEDVVEEVMGEIVDEYDEDEQDIHEDGGEWVVNGRVHLDDLNDEADLNLTSEEFDTLGGFVFGLFGRQPKQGETIEHSGCIFRVEEADGRRILKVRVAVIAPSNLLEEILE